MNLQKQLPRLIRELQRQGYSHQVIADRCGLSKYVIWKLANGERTRIETAEKFIRWLAKETGVYPSERTLPAPSAASTIVEGSIAYSEQWDAATNGRYMIPYRQTSPPAQRSAHEYTGPSRYLQSPKTYQSDLQRERGVRYKATRMPKQPDPPPSPTEPLWSQIGQALSRTFALIAEEA